MRLVGGGDPVPSLASDCLNGTLGDQARQQTNRHVNAQDRAPASLLGQFIDANRAHRDAASPAEPGSVNMPEVP